MKRLLAWLLTLCLVVSLLPGNAVVVSAEPAHDHYACSCALTGGNACTGHGTDPAPLWQEWTQTATLPTTTGNYYLTGDINLTNTAAMVVAADQNVVLCLNGHSVKFNSANTGAANYSVAAGAKLTVMNCRAKLDSKGLLVSGNKADATDLTAGRLYGGRGNSGGAIYSAGEVNLIGVELYDNGLPGTTSTFGGAVKLGAGAVLNTLHAKFDSNKARYGAAIANAGKDVTITLDDTILTKNEAIASSAGNGGAIYLKGYTAGTKDCLLIVKGDSQLTDNKSFSSGSAIYVSTENGAAATTACRVVLQDNVVISGNQGTRTSGAAKGAVSVDTGASTGKNSILAISGNVQIKDNTVSSSHAQNANNVGITMAKAKLEVGEMGTDAHIGVTYIPTATDPDSFMVKATAAQIADATNTGVRYENTDPAKAVYYSAAEGFYFYTPPAPVVHTHHACSCALENGKSCTGHGSQAELTWTAWTDGSALPTTTGNYYLTGDLNLTNTAAMEIANGQTVNLCLNGHSVKFNSANTGTNYFVAAGGKLNVINCQAKLDSKGLLASGNKEDTTDLTAGRLYGAKFSAIKAAGEVNLIGVELYGNGTAGSGRGGAVYLSGTAKLTAVHSKFDSNKANYGGAICIHESGNATITLDDTVLSKNEAVASSSGNGGAIYLKAFAAGTQNCELTIKGDSQITGNKSYSSGCAIYATTENKAAATTSCRIILQDNVVITGNQATRTSGAAKGAVSIDTGKDNGTPGLLEISGNVQIKDNTYSSSHGDNSYNVGFTNPNVKLVVGEMGANAHVGVTYIPTATDPDSFMVKAASAQIADATDTGVLYENTDPAKQVYYSTAEGFYFYDPNVLTPPSEPHIHHACACVITGDTDCQHEGSITWTPWLSTNSLPEEAGNYYLIADVNMTGNVKMTENVVLCLNGFSVKLDAASTDAPITAQKSLTVMNCQAKLDDKGLLVCGNKEDTTDLTAGRIYGGRSAKGGAIAAEGELTLLGVELYDNGSAGNGYGGAVKLSAGAVAKAAHSKFHSNKARYGAAIGNEGGNVTITLDDTVLSNNQAVASSAGNGGAIYLKAYLDAAQDNLLTIKGDSKLTRNKSYSSGSAIYVAADNATDDKASSKNRVVLQDNVEISGNEATRTSGAAKGAVAMDASASSGGVSVLAVSGNVQIKDNTVNSTHDSNAKNVGLSNAMNKIEVGELGADADIFVSTAATYDDPDSFLFGATGVTQAERNDIGITYEKIDPALTVGYDAVETFYLYDPTVPPAEPHFHQSCACEITGDTGCKHDTEDLSWRAWTRTDRLPTASGNFYLTGDVVIKSTSGAGSIGQYELQDGTKVNLCLNGFNIKFYDKNTSKTNYYAMTGSQLTIMNCKAKLDKDGKLVNDANSGGQITGGMGRYGGALYAKGDVKLIGVAFIGNKAAYDATEGMGGAVRVQDGGKLLVQHCLFENNEALSNGGAICTGRGEAELTIIDSVLRKNTTAVSGGAIAMNSASSKLTITDSVIAENNAESAGGAIYAKACQMTISGASVANNKAKNASGVYMESKSTCTITDTVIEGNIGATNAGGLYAKNNTKVTLGKGTVIRNNEAATGGGAILQTKSEMTFAGGSIENNKAKSGGGMTLWDQSVVYLTDGKVAGNEATEGAGGAIYMQSGADLVISGGAITGNKSATYGGGVYANMNDKVKTVEITVSGGEVSGNKTKTAGGGIYGLSAKMVISGGKISGNEAGSGGGVYLGSGTAAGETLGNFTMTGGEISGNKASTGGGVFHSTNSDALYSGGIVTKNTASTSGGGIHTKKARVVFDKDILITENESKSGGGICLQNETKLDFKGGRIEKNTGSSGGGAMLWSKSELHLNGGTIQNNKSTGSGGGVYMQSGSYLYVNSGKITGNTSTKAGGGVFSNGNNTDRMTIKVTGGEISKNTAGTQAGGVYVGGAKAGSAMTMTGGSIRNNTATAQQGGGIYVAEKCSLTMWGGSVSGNYTKQTGGGIYASKSTLILYGGAVSNNKCEASGGGIHTSGGKLELHGGTISYNYAGAYGGGIRTYNSTEFTMTGGNILYNEAENRGGGVALWSNMTMTGGSVSYNAVIGDPDGKDTNTYGGGIAICDNNSVYVKDHYTLDITDGEFIGNTSLHKGGALSVTGECYIYVKDSVFKENEALLGGAIIADNHANNRSVPSELYVTACQFEGNKAEEGGAIYGNWSSETTVADSVFIGNTAANAGGAIHLRSQSVGWLSTSQFTQNTAGQKGAAIYCADDVELDSLTITGNNSGDGYALYIEEGAFDGISVVKAIVKISGDMKVYENNGAKPDMFIAKDAMVHVNYAGLGKDARIHVELAEGILTNTLIGVYNYEGGNLKYTVTYGDRSITDPEPIPGAEPEAVDPTMPATEPTATEPGAQSTMGIGGIAAISGVLVAAVVAVIAAVAVKKKKKADAAKDAVQE